VIDYLKRLEEFLNRQQQPNEERSPFLTPTERMRELFMPMQQIREEVPEPTGEAYDWEQKRREEMASRQMGAFKVVKRLWDEAERPYHAISNVVKYLSDPEVWEKRDVVPDEFAKGLGKAFVGGLTMRDKTRLHEWMWEERLEPTIPEEQWVARGAAKTVADITQFYTDPRYLAIGKGLQTILKEALKGLPVKLPKWAKHARARQEISKQIEKSIKQEHAARVARGFKYKEVEPLAHTQRWVRAHDIALKEMLPPSQQFAPPQWARAGAERWADFIDKFFTKYDPLDRAIREMVRRVKVNLPFTHDRIDLLAKVVERVHGVGAQITPQQLIQASQLASQVARGVLPAAKFFGEKKESISKFATQHGIKELTRIGDITGGSAYFGIVGQTTYEGGKNYVLSPDAKIADLTNVKIADVVIGETLKDKRLTGGERSRLREAIGQGDIDYLLFDETPMSDAVKRLGYDAATVRENTDMPGEASSIFVVNISKVSPKSAITPEEEREIIRKPPGKIEKEPETGPIPEIERVYPGKEIEPDIMKPKVKPRVDIPKPPEEMGGLAELEYRKDIKPVGLATKIGNLYTKIEEAGGVGRISQERTIMNMIEKGQEMAARSAFREGQRQGIFKTTEKFEDMLTRRKERAMLRDRVKKARQQIFGVDVKHLRPQFRDDIKGLIEDLDNVITRKAKTLYRLQRMADYVAEHPDNNLPQSQLEHIRRLDKKPLGELTVEEVEDIAKQVQQFARLNKLENKLIFGRRLREAKEVIDSARVNVNKKQPRGEFAEDLIDVAEVEKRAGKLQQIFSTDSYNPEMIANILDANPEGGIVSEVLYGGVDEGVTQAFTYERAAEAYMRDVIKSVGLQGKDLARMSRGVGGDKAEVVSIALPSGKKINMTRGDRMSLILHASSAENTSNIINNGFNFTTNLSRQPFKISKEDFRAIVDSASETEKRIAYAIARYLNTVNKNMINATSVDLDGFEIATVDNYWTLRRNPLYIKRDPSKLRKNFTQATLEGMGILKERTGAQMPVVVEDALSQFYKLIRQSSSYAGLAKPLRNAKMLLMDREFKRDVIQRFGRHYWDSLDNYIRQIEDNSHKLGNVDKLGTELINKLDLALLGMNPSVALKQFPSFLLAMTEMEPRYILSALTHGVGAETKAEISRWSPQLARRLEGRITRELGELGQVGSVRRFWTGQSPISHHVLDPIRLMDTQAIGRIWHAVKAEVRAKSPDLTGDEYMKAVARRAEKVIRRTQPTWDMKDRSAIARSQSTFVRLLTKYTSQRNKNIQIIRRAWLEYQASPKTAKDKANLLSKWFLVTLGMSIMIEGINTTRDLMMGKKPKPWQFKLLRAFGNSVSYVYIVGEMFNSLASKIERGTYAGYDMSNPLQSMGETGINAIAETYWTLRNIVEGEKYKGGKKKGQAKWKTSMWRMIDHWAHLAGMRYGIPYHTLRNYIRGAYRIAVPEEKKIKSPTSDAIKEIRRLYEGGQ